MQPRQWRPASSGNRRSITEDPVAGDGFQHTDAEFLWLLAGLRFVPVGKPLSARAQMSVNRVSERSRSVVLRMLEHRLTPKKLPGHTLPGSFEQARPARGGQRAGKKRGKGERQRRRSWTAASMRYNQKRYSVPLDQGYSLYLQRSPHELAVPRVGADEFVVPGCRGESKVKGKPAPGRYLWGRTEESRTIRHKILFNRLGA